MFIIGGVVDDLGEGWYYDWYVVLGLSWVYWEVDVVIIIILIMMMIMILGWFFVIIWCKKRFFFMFWIYFWLFCYGYIDNWEMMKGK